jgi:hypothetical protein
MYKFFQKNWQGYNFCYFSQTQLLTLLIYGKQYSVNADQLLFCGKECKEVFHAQN